MIESRAERFASARGWTCVVLAVVTSAWTAVLSGQVTAGDVRWINVLALGAWVALTLVWTLAQPGWGKWSRDEKDVINDELAKEHQRVAVYLLAGVLLVGLAVGSGPVLWAMSVPEWWPIATLGLGVAACALLFGALQIRSA